MLSSSKPHDLLVMVGAQRLYVASRLYAHFRLSMTMHVFQLIPVLCDFICCVLSLLVALKWIPKLNILTNVVPRPRPDYILTSCFVWLLKVGMRVGYYDHMIWD